MNEPVRPETVSHRMVWSRIFTGSTEGKILLSGIVLTGLGLASMLLVAIWDPIMSRIIGVMAFTNIAVGRAVSMSIGYAAGQGHGLVLAVNMVTETILVLLFYPLFVFSVNKLISLEWIKNLLERTHEAAAKHEGKVRKYGIVGLFTFVWFPFWMTGPVVGSAIGYLLGFPAWLTLVAVLAGTYVAMVAWAFFLFDIQKRAAAWGEWAPLVIIGMLVAVVLIGYLFHRNKE